MNKLAPIKRENMLAAADQLDALGKSNRSDYFLFVTEKGKEYPFKQLVRRAYEEAMNKKIDGTFFRSNPENRDFISDKFGYPISFRTEGEVPFFMAEEIAYFNQWAGEPYRTDVPEEVEVGRRLKESVILKTATWANAIGLEGFEVRLDNSWQRRGVFASWTWARIYRKEDEGKKVFFTVGVDAGEDALIYKLDCHHTAAVSENALTEAEKQLFHRIVDATDAGWQYVMGSELVEYGWESLVSDTRDFIEHYTPLYDEVIRAIWEEELAPPSIPGGLRETEPPSGGTTPTGHRKIVFSENADYEWENEKKKSLGDRGEKLVKSQEERFLRDQGRDDLADRVRKVFDWEGFDILSFYPDGREKYIEVKTTTGIAERPFYLSANELRTMREHPEQYCLYRLYNYNEITNSAVFFWMEGDITDRLVFEPLQFKVVVKGQVSGDPNLTP